MNIALLAVSARDTSMGGGSCLRTTIAVVGRNLTNGRYNAYAIDQSPLGIVVAIKAEPRSYGLELSNIF